MTKVREIIGQVLFGAGHEYSRAVYAVDREVDAILAALAERGYAVVPVEASEAMQNAACNQDWGIQPLPDDCARVYRAMIRAAQEGEG